MKKYFVCSDTHSFYTPLRQALKKSGFDTKNENHVFIVLGDLFDRGLEAIKLYKFLKSIPEDRLILIKGNHEYLFFNLLEKPFPEGHDFHNGTVDTFCQIANKTFIDEGIKTVDYLKSASEYCREFGMTIDIDVQKDWNEIKEAVKKSKLFNWLKNVKWHNYYEINNFIFVHSFIPVKLKDSNAYNTVIGRRRELEDFEYGSDWRGVEGSAWEPATWGCPYMQYKVGLFNKEIKKNKILVCGHWHTADFYRYLKNYFAYANSCAPIYYSKNLIGLDGGVYYDFFNDSLKHEQNILIIEDNVCYDKFNTKLEEIAECPRIETVTLDYK